MKYTIVVDKQSSSNPSEEKREYTIDIEELRTYKGVSDTLTVSSTTYVTRKLKLSEYGVLSILPTPQIEEVKDVDIILFEGENYIYILNEQGNKISASYLIKNDLTDTFPSKVEMATSIAQSAGQVEISVDKKLENYSTTEETKGLIKVESDEINLELSKKVNDEDLTGANLALRINEDDSSEAVINADSININGVISANGNFKVNTNGDMVCNNGTFNGGKVDLIGGTQENSFLNVFKDSNKKNTERFFATDNRFGVFGGNVNKNILAQSDDNGTTFSLNGDETNYITNTVFGDGFDFASTTWRSGNSTTQVDATQIRTPKLTQTSLESIKKNISLYNENALQTILNSDIYTYNLKSEKDDENKHIGFVIGKGYRTPKQVMNNEQNGIELYSAIGILWKGMQEHVQEQQKKIEELENKLKEVTNG